MELNKKWFEEKIKWFLLNDESNKMIGVDGILMFEPEKFLVGFVDGKDLIFEEYKKIIGEFHLTPLEAIGKFCKKRKIDCSMSDLSVVAYITNKQEN